MGKVEIEKIKSMIREKTSGKVKISLLVAALILIISVSYSIGKNTATISLEKEKVTYDELQNQIKGKESDLSQLTKTLTELETTISEKNSTNKELNTEISNKESLLKEVELYSTSKTEKTQEITNLDSEITKLSADIESKKTELASVSEAIIKQKAAPIQLSAGQYIVGQDIPAGRYKAIPVGRGSNLFVFDTSGSSVVNTILGNSDISTPEYVFYAFDDYIIETRAAAQFIPVE